MIISTIFFLFLEVPSLNRKEMAVKQDQRARVLSEENDFVYDPCAQQYLVGKCFSLQ